MAKLLTLLFKPLLESLRDLAPIILVIAFFQLAVLQQDIPDLGSLLVGLLRQWTVRLELERLSAYGVTEAHFPRIVADSRGSSMQTNPVVLTDEEITEILRRRL